jgi:GNAT superfamily N-acetyltransferase
MSASKPPAGAPLRVDFVRSGDAAPIRRIRLDALASDPSAFSSTLARESAFPEERWTAWASDSHAGVDQRSFVLVDEAGAWVGLAVARRDPEASDVALVNGMWIAPAARGRGGSRSLADAAAGWAAERGFAALELAVLRGNEPALRAYLASGFSVVDDPDSADATRHGCAADDLVLRRPLPG